MRFSCCTKIQKREEVMAKNQRRKSRGFRNSSGKFVPDYYSNINTRIVDLPLFIQAKDIRESFKENGLITVK